MNPRPASFSLPPKVGLSERLGGELGLGSLGYLRECHVDYLTTVK